MHSVSLLARHGFRYNEVRKEIECVDCKSGITLPSLAESHKPSCRFLCTADRFLKIQRIPTHEEFCLWIKYMEEFDLVFPQPQCPLGEYEVKAFINWQIYKERDIQAEELSLDPEFTQHENRMSSFANTDLDSVMVKELARNGFWYLENQIHCVYCGITWTRPNWPTEGETQEKHKKHSPLCPYLKQQTKKRKWNDGP